MSRVAVVGAGSWGTALALVAARAGNEVSLWSHSRDVAAALAGERVNSVYLPGFPLPENIAPSGDLARVLEGAEMAVTAVPSHVCREVFSAMKPLLPATAILVSATKGIEIATQMRIEQVFVDVFGSDRALRYVALSGPSFALEVAKDEPCAIVAAATDISAAAATQRVLSSRRFRVYTNTDVVGVEVGGAIKNVMAIAVGVVSGLGLGYNSAAALVTRGLAEMIRLATRLGGRSETLAGLAGMGDLVLTCFGNLSRNRRVGYELGKGRRLDEIVGEMREVAEGVKTARAAIELSRRLNVEMPITEGVYQMLYEQKSPRDLELELMERPLKGE